MASEPSTSLPYTEQGRTRRGTRLRRWAAREHGASAIEYALIAGLIAVSIIGALSLAGTNLGNLFDTIATEVGDAADSGSSGSGS